MQGLKYWQPSAYKKHEHGDQVNDRDDTEVYYSCSRTPWFRSRDLGIIFQTHTIAEHKVYKRPAFEPAIQRKTLPEGTPKGQKEHYRIYNGHFSFAIGL